MGILNLIDVRIVKLPHLIKRTAYSRVSAAADFLESALDDFQEMHLVNSFSPDLSLNSVIDFIIVVLRCLILYLRGRCLTPIVLSHGPWLARQWNVVFRLLAQGFYFLSSHSVVRHIILRLWSSLRVRVPVQRCSHISDGLFSNMNLNIGLWRLEARVDIYLLTAAELE